MDNNIINKYVYDVIRRLPKKEQDEVESELKANIYDMLSEHPSESEVKTILQELGHPSQLAEQYRQNPKYLISPAMYDQYIRILKWILPLVAGIMITLGAILGCLDALVSSSDMEIKNIVKNTIKESISLGIRMGISGVFQALVWTTVGFVIAQKSGYQEKLIKEWDIENIPEIPENDKDKISLPEIITEMALSIIFNVIGILICSGIIPITFSFTLNKTFVKEIFSSNFLQICIPILVIILLFSIFEHIIKLIYRRWCTSVFVGVVINNIVSTCSFIYLLTRPNIFSEEFLTFVRTNDWGTYDITQFFTTNGSNPIIIIVIVIIVIVAIATIAYALYKTIKAQATS